MTVLLLLMVTGYCLFAVFVGKVIALGDVEFVFADSPEADIARDFLPARGLRAVAPSSPNAPHSTGTRNRSSSSSAGNKPASRLPCRSLNPATRYDGRRCR